MSRPLSQMALFEEGSRPRDLAALLAARAAAVGGEQPWLFYRPGLDWRWRSWRWAAARVEDSAAALRQALPALREARRPPAIAFREALRVESVLIDLAIRAAGARPLPVAEGGATPDAVAWATPGDEGDGQAGLIEVVLTSVRAGAGSEVLLEEVAALGRATGRSPRHLERAPSAALPSPDAPLLARGAALAATLRPTQPLRSPPVADVAALARSLGRPLAETLLAWSILAGASLALEPDPAHHLDTARWVRPTVFAGDAGERARLLAEREAAPGRSRRPTAWGRLRAVVAEEAGADAGEARRWAALGVAFVAPAADSSVV